MIREVVTVSINGQRQDDLVPDIVEISVEEAVDVADVFRVRLSIAMRNDGTWTHVDDPALAPWNRVALRAGYPADSELLIDGYITHVDVVLSGTGGEDSYLELTGMDATARMDLEDRQVAWPNKKDSEIAQQIFASYGLGSEVEDTEVAQSDRIATTLQSETDIRFLRRLAERNGFECHVSGGKGYFRRADLQSPPQKVLALQFGPESNLTSLRVAVDATPPTQVDIRRVDPIEKREEREAIEQLPQRPLGRRSLAALAGPAHRARRLLRHHASASAGEMKARLRAGYGAATAFVVASGEVDARSYGAVLRARRLVTIKGAGGAHSGHYYVTRVHHQFSVDGYVQSFEAVRNGLGVVGDERFAAPTGPMPAALGAAGLALPGRS